MTDDTPRGDAVQAADGPGGLTERWNQSAEIMTALVRLRAGHPEWVIDYIPGGLPMTTDPVFVARLRAHGRNAETLQAATDDELEALILTFGGEVPDDDGDPPPRFVSAF